MSNPTLTEAAPDVTVAEPVPTVLADEAELVTADLLVEDVSIDGECRVYKAGAAQPGAVRPGCAVRS